MPNRIEHPLVTAAAVHAALTAELAWLKVAQRNYSAAKYRKMVDYSANRMAYRIRHEYGCGCDGVRFIPLDATATRLAIDIAWAGDSGAEVLHALAEFLNPAAKC
jgi:hypothetical protein